MPEEAHPVELASWMKVLDSQVEWKDSYINLVKYPEKETCKIQDIWLAISVYIYCSMLGKRRVVLGMMGAPGKMNSKLGFYLGLFGLKRSSFPQHGPPNAPKASSGIFPPPAWRG